MDRTKIILLLVITALLVTVVIIFQQKNTNSVGADSISGNFLLPLAGESDNLRFIVTSGNDQIPAGARFSFVNSDKAEHELGLSTFSKLSTPSCDQLTGAAEITVAKYTDPDKEDDVMSFAELVSVQNILQPASCSKYNP